MTAYRIGIIGCGNMGQQHAKAWAAHEQANITIVSDPDQDRAESLAADYAAQALHRLARVPRAS